jgi:hypothetical protein
MCEFYFFPYTLYQKPFPYVTKFFKIIVVQHSTLWRIEDLFSQCSVVGCLDAFQILRL